MINIFNQILGPIKYKFYYGLICLENDFILGNFMFIFEADICDNIIFCHKLFNIYLYLMQNN